MEKTSTLVNSIFSNTKDYVNLKTKSLKLEAYEKTADAVSGSVNGVALFVLGLCAFMFLNVGVAWWLSEVFMSTKLGFFTLGGFYVLCMGIYFAVKTSIASGVKNKVVSKMSKNEITTYELVLKNKESVNNQLSHAETLVKENAEELKENLNTLVNDVKRLKNDIARVRNIFNLNDEAHAPKNNEPSDLSHEENINRVAPRLPRMAVNAIFNLLLSKLVLKNAGAVVKTVVPIVANTVLNSKLFKEPVKTSFFENLKMRLAKLF